MLAMKDEKITFRITRADKAALEKDAADSGRSVGGMIRWVLGQWRSKNKREKQ